MANFLYRCIEEERPLHSFDSQRLQKEDFTVEIKWAFLAEFWRKPFLGGVLMEQFLANVFANLVAGIILTLITHRRGEKKEFPAITDEDINNKTLGFNHRPRKCLVF